jgi:hypothetical protein
MANYLATDTDLEAVADAIRAKSGGSGQLAFPSGFVSEIGNIPSGGGGEWTSDGIAAGTEPNGDIVLTGNTIANRAFYGRPITGISAPNVTTVGYASFYKSSVKTARFDNLETIGDGDEAGYLFEECRSLEKAIFPKLKTIGSGNKCMFYNAGTTSSYKAVIVMPKVTSLGAKTFDRCYVDKIDIGPGVTALSGSDVFYCNTDTKTVNVLILRYTGGVVTTGNTDRIKGLRDVYVPNDLISSYQTASNWSTRYNAGKITFHAIEGSPYEHYYADGTAIPTT